MPGQRWDGKPKDRSEVILLPDAAVVGAGSLSNSAEVEPNHSRRSFTRSSRQPENDLVVHRPAVERVGMAYHSHSLDGSRVIRAFY